MTAAAEPVSEPVQAEPFYLRGPAADAPPVELAFHEKSALRAAALRAKRVYPGPVGELVSREILAWEDFGKLLGGDGLIMSLVRQVMTASLPVE